MGNAEIFFAVVSLVNVSFTAWVAFGRSKSQNIVDDSTASSNFRKIALDLQAELETVRSEMEAVKEGVILNLGLSLEIGKPPIVTHFEWINKNKKEIST